MERFRAHPKVAPFCMNQEAADRMAARTAAWTAEEKCQLNHGVLIGGIFPDLP